jgi:hypothetical protein
MAPFILEYSLKTCQEAAIKNSQTFFTNQGNLQNKPFVFIAEEFRL